MHIHLTSLGTRLVHTPVARRDQHGILGNANGEREHVMSNERKD